MDIKGIPSELDIESEDVNVLVLKEDEEEDDDVEGVDVNTQGEANEKAIEDHPCNA